MGRAASEPQWKVGSHITIQVTAGGIPRPGAELLRLALNFGGFDKYLGPTSAKFDLMDKSVASTGILKTPQVIFLCSQRWELLTLLGYCGPMFSQALTPLLFALHFSPHLLTIHTPCGLCPKSQACSFSEPPLLIGPSLFQAFAQPTHTLQCPSLFLLHQSHICV